MRSTDVTVSNLGNMHKAFYTRSHFNECTESSKTLHSTSYNVAGFKVILNVGPRTCLSCFDAQADFVIGRIKFKYLYFHFVAFFDNI
ncbi:hypothetical protein D3C84_902060 [compost metagenome]